jgi:hypothetical protein
VAAIGTEEIVVGRHYYLSWRLSMVKGGMVSLLSPRTL